MSRKQEGVKPKISCFFVANELPSSGFIYWVVNCQGLATRSAFLNRRVATSLQVVEDFQRVVGIVQNDYYIACLLKIGLH